MRPRQLRHTSASQWHEWRWQGLRIILPFSLKFGRAIYIRLGLHGRVRAAGQKKGSRGPGLALVSLTPRHVNRTARQKPTVDDWSQCFGRFLCPVQSMTFSLHSLDFNWCDLETYILFSSPGWIFFFFFFGICSSVMARHLKVIPQRFLKALCTVTKKLNHFLVLVQLRNRFYYRFILRLFSLIYLVVVFL